VGFAADWGVGSGCMLRPPQERERVTVILERRADVVDTDSTCGLWDEMNFSEWGTRRNGAAREVTWAIRDIAMPI
jgi:hypothetical protein